LWAIVYYCRADLGIRNTQTQGENLKALQAKFDDRGEVAGNCSCKFLLQSLIKINKRQYALRIDGTMVRWRVEAPEAKVNSFVEATVAFVQKFTKTTDGLASL